MNLFTTNLEKVGYDEFRAFCEENLPEGTRLEYKRQPSAAYPRFQVVKAVSAFANTQGGLLVFGVGTKGAGRYPDWPSEGMNHDPALEQKIRAWCLEDIWPPLVPWIRYIPSPSNEAKAFALVRVDQSDATPHTVGRGTRIYVRRADHSQPALATFQEIELLRNARERARQFDQEHTKRMKWRLDLGTPSRVATTTHIVTPVLGQVGAIPRAELERVVESLRARGFTLAEPRSYSDGLMGAREDGRRPEWVWALTLRGDLGMRHLDLQGKPDPVDLNSLLGWALFAEAAVNCLAEAAGHWGMFRVSISATGLGGRRVIDSGNFYDHPRVNCVDAAVAVELTVSVLDAKSQPFVFAAEVFEHLMWAVGQGAAPWPREATLKRLRARRRV